MGKIEWDLIGPEIKNDDFYFIIKSIIASNNFTNVLEIGASSGQGSTEAILSGRGSKPIKVFSIEACTERFNDLKERYKDIPNFFPYNYSSVPLRKFPNWAEVEWFMTRYRTSSLAVWPLETVKGWLEKDIEYVRENGISEYGIEMIKAEHSIENFDCVLIDGSEFTGRPELDIVYGSKVIMLDDTRAFKNWANHHRLKSDPNYSLLMENNLLRNGFSIFSRNW